MNSAKATIVLVAATSGIAFFSATAGADSIQNDAVFGNTGVIFDGFSTTIGNVGSNSDIDALGASTNITSMRALGNFNGIGDFQTITGQMDFNGYVNGGGLSSYGSIDAGGSVSIQGNVTGNITTGPNLFLSTFNTVGGNALAAGAANLAGSNTISGTPGANGNIILGNYESEPVAWRSKPADRAAATKTHTTRQLQAVSESRLAGLLLDSYDKLARGFGCVAARALLF